MTGHGGQVTAVSSPVPSLYRKVLLNSFDNGCASCIRLLQVASKHTDSSGMKLSRLFMQFLLNPLDFIPFAFF